MTSIAINAEVYIHFHSLFAVCKSKLSPTEMNKVIVQQIPNDQEHIQTWIDFLNPLEMARSMVNWEEMSPCDARGNVCHVLLAWLGGKGTPEKPRTWGTLLDAMRTGSQYLQKLANRAEYILLGKMCTECVCDARWQTRGGWKWTNSVYNADCVVE